VSAAEAISHYAGGQAVLAAAQKVESANSGSITAAAERLTKAGTSVAQHGTGVSTAVKQLDDAWQGASADQFVAYMDRFAKAGTANGEGLAKAGAALTKVASAIDDAKHYVANRCEQALGEIRRFAQQNPEADQAQIDAAAAPITAAAATDIENKLKETEEQLKSAVAQIKAAANPSSRFGDIPDPGTQPYVPGKKVEWDRTPRDQSTSPSGTDSQPKEMGPGNHSNPSGGGSGSGGSGSGGGGGASGGGGGGGMGSSGGPPAGPVPGNVQDWIKQALEILRANGINVSEADVPKIWAIIQHESGGNPHAINNWDSNAAKGTPSGTRSTTSARVSTTPFPATARWPTSPASRQWRAAATTAATEPARKPRRSRR
jgi:uncharacterized protein YukE